MEIEIMTNTRVTREFQAKNITPQTMPELSTNKGQTTETSHFVTAPAANSKILFYELYYFQDCVLTRDVPGTALF